VVIVSLCVPTYTTLFVATDQELDRFWPGWRLPAAAPVRAFGDDEWLDWTGQPWPNISGEVWDPGPPSERSKRASVHDAAGRAVVPPLLPVSGFQAQLEENAPALLRTFPHVAARNVTPVELEGVAIALLGEFRPPARMVDCGDQGGVFGSLPADAVAALARITDADAPEVIRRIDETLMEPPRGEDAEAFLDRMRRLAKIAVERRGHVMVFVVA
jgi:hypothetical protein